MPQTTAQLLESLASGHVMTSVELDDLLTNQVAEDLYLDYKHGNELNDSRKARRTVRRYMSGFANSDGGILIVGVDEASWSVTGATAPGGGDLAEWAASCLNQTVSHFSPTPRFHVINHSDGNVLVAYTSRSLGIVPCYEGGNIVYYLRHHDQTLKAPEYLVSDILLGRRRQPYLQITEFSLRHVSTHRDNQNNYDLTFSPVLKVENQGLLRAKNVRVGIVSLVRIPLSNVQLLSSYLLSFINVKEHPIGPCSHEVTSVADIEPFSVSLFGRFGDYRLPLSKDDNWSIPYCWKAAAYVTAEEGSPTWYQLNFDVNSDLLQMIRISNSGPIVLEHGSPFQNFERLTGTQPIVSIEN